MEPVKIRQTSRVMSAPRMVEKYLCSRGIRDPRVLGAMSKVPRERFVPEILRERAYSDHPLPIGHDQTISQPYIVAIMSQALELEGKEKILEIGTGSGYQTAILAELARSVFSVERIHLLTMDARKRLDALGYHNISTQVGNGAQGWKEYAPYQGILITAAVVSFPKVLMDQLDIGGKMVLPVSMDSKKQSLFCLTKTKEGIQKRVLCSCSFVPFI